MSTAIKNDDETIAKVKALLDEKLTAPVEESDIPIPDAPKEEIEPPVDTPRNTTYDSTANTQNALYSWSMNSANFGDVTVTDMDKSMYLKAALNDVPVILPIELEMQGTTGNKIIVEIRTLNNYEMDLVFWALEKDREEGLLTNPSAIATRLQYYAGGLQTIKVNKQPVSNIQFPEPGDTVKDGTKLREFIHAYIQKINWPRWQAILIALRIFETKTKICNDAALNGNFWKPQDAAS